MTYSFSNLSKNIRRSEIREILKWTRKPGLISFGGGLPDSDLFPLKEIADITKEVLDTKGYLALQYGQTKGEPEMVQALCQHMQEFGDDAACENVCVVSSSQQGLDLLSMLFLDDQTPIIVEMPTYLGALQAFRRHNANMIGISMDNDGMKMDELEKTLSESEKQPRFIYTIPDFQNPSGITMSVERRNQLIAIAEKYGVPIVEDSPYRELRYIGETLPSIWKLSGGKNVIMLKTFSKILFPGMRMGWVVAEEEIIDKFVVLKQSVDLCTPSFNQLILASYIEKGMMKETIEKAKKCYKPKKDAMLKSLEKFMPPGVRWSKPEGGMFLWVELPESIDTKEIFMTAIEHDVAYVIGAPFYHDGRGKNTMRLSYSFPSLEQIREGIERLAKMVKSIL
ncbi:MAG: PLP-dependent aminotransferase family protein [Candidatus Marinimicrobia bacterium]|nr:PLP-dependent aminotransferase family protein [Candidatus Neomarinimicrobiota bacterium]